jgi:hypothetical protein
VDSPLHLDDHHGHRCGLFLAGPLLQVDPGSAQSLNSPRDQDPVLGYGQKVGGRAGQAGPGGDGVVIYVGVLGGR